MVRGIEKRPLFVDDRDRRFLLDRACQAFDKDGCRCLTWSLMLNHWHMKARTESGSLSKSMHRLETSYAMYFNRRHDRCGHLVQNRFKSLLVEDEEYLLRVSRYVMLNPIEAVIVTDLDELRAYPWTSYPDLMGDRGFQLTDSEFTLKLFSDNPEQARRDLTRWMQAGIDEPDDIGKILERGPGRPVVVDPYRSSAQRIADRDSYVIGDPAFIRRVLAEARHPKAKQTRRTTSGWSTDLVLAEVCERLGATSDKVREGRRDRRTSAARAATAWISHTLLDVSLVDLAAVLAVSPSALSHAMARGREIAHEHCADLLILLQAL